mmetsp:Transcript_64462/g.165869  ORF Transcript_64462/g.165869 Transcript_64462/m.165869 type:complete len:273 (-) Transcript_64462:1478-2296(-)
MALRCWTIPPAPGEPAYFTLALMQSSSIMPMCTFALRRARRITLNLHLRSSVSSATQPRATPRSPSSSFISSPRPSSGSMCVFAISSRPSSMMASSLSCARTTCKVSNPRCKDGRRSSLRMPIECPLFRSLRVPEEPGISMSLASPAPVESSSAWMIMARSLKSSVRVRSTSKYITYLKSAAMPPTTCSLGSHSGARAFAESSALFAAAWHSCIFFTSLSKTASKPSSMATCTASVKRMAICLGLSGTRTVSIAIWMSRAQVTMPISLYLAS